ncbi:MAG TPA: HD domain-containing phosphohydrolase [Gaiellales bacterium]|nr:HD domain-containing phosphohydrolase [Gaiellales bacterium]
MSVRVGEALGMEKPELELLQLAAAVHDVGKISVPQSILTKDGPLDRSEWRKMRAHSAAGARLLAACEAPTAIQESVRSHHERWDGRGYPDRLKAEAIPLAARIIAVVDAYWAMVEARPYRPPRQPSSACAELLIGAGTQFDSNCARVTCSILTQTV